MSTLAELLGRAPLSIQKVAGVAAMAAFTDFTVAPVNPSSTVVLVPANKHANAADGAAVVQTDTTVRWVPWAQPGGTYPTPDIWVIDFGAMVKSVQRGMLAQGIGDAAATLAPINPAKAVVIMNQRLDGGLYGTLDNTHLRSTLTATSLTLKRGSWHTVHWQVIEFH